MGPTVNIRYGEDFLKEAKKLSKKYKNIKSDLKEAVDEIALNMDFGTYLGNNLYKKRVKNTSIPTGKSGGFRIIIFKQIENEIVLISIYSKTEKEILNDDEIRILLNNFFK